MVEFNFQIQDKSELNLQEFNFQIQDKSDLILPSR